MKDYYRKTKIIVTIGPSISKSEVMDEILKSGVNIFRINFSHSDHEEHEKSIKLIRKLSLKLGKEVGILGDLQGPKIRLVHFEIPIEVENGKEIIISTKPSKNNKNIISTSYANLAKDVKAGERILIDDGMVEMRVIKSLNDTDVLCEVIRGGILKSRKGINLPDTNITTASLTPKDIDDIKFIIKHNLDFVALSFVRYKEDIINFKKVMAELNSSIPIIAKIEKPEALHNIEGIIKAAYGIMVARGDLGVEIPAEKVPFEQKKIVRMCNMRGKPVIIATQILESMIKNSVQTRAETSDLANAILDGADALMLSAETSSGNHPEKAVKTMDRVIKAVEDQFVSRKTQNTLDSYLIENTSDSVCFAAVKMSIDLKAKMICCVTKGGKTALKIAKYRPSVPILAITDNDQTIRKLILISGVFSAKSSKINNTLQFLNETAKIIDNQEFLNDNDLVVFTVGLPSFSSGSTNTIKVHRVSKTRQSYFL